MLGLLQAYTAAWNKAVAGPLRTEDPLPARAGGDGGDAGDEWGRSTALEEAAQGVATAVAACQPLAERPDFRSEASPP